MGCGPVCGWLLIGTGALQAEWNKQGGESGFQFEILETLPEDVVPMAVADLLRRRRSMGCVNPMRKACCSRVTRESLRPCRACRRLRDEIQSTRGTNRFETAND